MFSRTLALSHSMQCCLPTFSANPHLEKEASQHIPDWKLTESNSSGLIVDPSFSQIHPRSGENKHSATAHAEAPEGKSDCRESRAPAVIPCESQLLTAGQAPLTSRMGDPCLPEGRKESSATTEQSLGFQAGGGQDCGSRDSCPAQQQTRIQREPHCARMKLRHSRNSPC